MISYESIKYTTFLVHVLSTFAHIHLVGCFLFFFFFNQPLTYARSGDVNIPSVLNRYRIFYKTLNLSQCSIMSSTFYHIFDGYWLCLDLSSSCVESNCFVIVPRGKTTYYGLVSLRLTREKGSVPCVTLVNLILLSDIEEIWVDGMDNSYVSAT